MTDESDIEARWEHAIACADLAGILCTGRPGRAKCNGPGALPVILYNELFAVVCRECAEPLLSGIAASGLAAGLRCAPIDEMFRTQGQRFATGARVIRDHNQRHGVAIRVR